jgi:DNA polymerase-3 subunit delta'
MLDLTEQFAALPWLNSERERLTALAGSDRCPHALLIHGQPGTGRRHLAIWLAERLLNKQLDFVAGEDERIQLHPDLLTIEPEPDKRDISVEQIRELIEFTELTSYQGAGRCAIIYPVERLNKSGFNSLLKTLEEPPQGVVLVLLSESLSRLPATIVSRCQRLHVPVPAAAAALEWLASRNADPELADLLSVAGGGPLAALELAVAGLGEQAQQCAADLENLELRRADPVQVANAWAREPDFALKWLYWKVAGQIRTRLTQTASADADFVKLDQIRELRRFIHGGVSAELGLTGLLVQWYGAGDNAVNKHG